MGLGPVARRSFKNVDLLAKPPKESSRILYGLSDPCTLPVATKINSPASYVFLGQEKINATTIIVKNNLYIS
ncbi:MAG: hypothetical protein CM1200mP10_29210 [Candidatus Neomarinimicrobiota bacterium]|nr:MAG: hypothetical protein CM1200mP10_29210 [Candidatus Neomarinimicrobiota bacterium]